MIGGSESIRDIQEARNSDSDAYEFSLIESLFSMQKIFSAFENVFSDNLRSLGRVKIFINLSTFDGMRMLSEIDKLVLPGFLNESNIVFNFDRRSIARAYNQIQSNDFEVSEYEVKINPIIQENISELTNLKYHTCISGGTHLSSVVNLMNAEIIPHYLKYYWFRSSF